MSERIQWVERGLVSADSVPELVTTLAQEHNPDVISVMKADNRNREGQVISVYNARTGMHDGIKLDEAARELEMTLAHPRIPQEHLGSVIAVLLSGKTVFAQEVVCLRVREVTDYGVMYRGEETVIPEQQVAGATEYEIDR